MSLSLQYPDFCYCGKQFQGIIDWGHCTHCHKELTEHNLEESKHCYNKKVRTYIQSKQPKLEIEK